MLWAVTGHTAAEIVALRSDPEAPTMGLTSWKGTVVRKGDVAVAKNYLDRDEIKDLDQIVTMYLDYAETQACRRRLMTMAEWAEWLDAFFQFNERELFTHAGTVRAGVARALAEDRYEHYDQRRRALDAQEADEADLQILRELEHRADAKKNDEGDGV